MAKTDQETAFSRVLDEIAASRVSALAVTPAHVSRATDISRQIGLLYGDALIVVVMHDRGLTQLASLDPDFDNVPAVIRYAPG